MVNSTTSAQWFLLSIGKVAGGLAVAVALTSCSFFETPFSLSTDNVDESGADRAAAITIGDPQVYARETLINDRRRESVYLQGMIDAKDGPVFTPQIARDLATLSALRAALSVTADPASAKRTQYQQQREEIQQEIEMTKLEQELDQLRTKKPTAPPESTGSTPPAEQPNSGANNTPPPAGSSPPPPGQQPDAKKLLDSFETMKKDLATLRTELQLRENNAKVRVVGKADEALSLSPLDEFRDKQAYRAELRAALQAVNLDDLHDFGGNTLYRLQFQATLFPGEKKGKFGAAQLTLHPPLVTREEANSLYYSWIGHIAQRLNPSYSTVSPVWGANDFYKMLGEQTETFDTSCLEKEIVRDDGKTKRKENVSLCLPVQRGASEIMSRALAKDGRESISSLSSELSRATTCSRFELLPSVRMIDTALSAMDPYWLRDFQPELDRYKSNVKAPIERARRTSGCTAETLEQAVDAPAGFRRRLFSDEGCFSGGDKTCELAGKAYAYATTPIELGQRISTTASAAQSFELALAASANLAESGVDLAGSLNFVRSAAGHIDAVERLPLTIGYSSRISGTPGRSSSPDSGLHTEPEFGWVFGPAVRVDAEHNRLELRQVARSETLTADLSIPAWWPSATFTVKSAWIGNWRSGHQVFTGNAEGSDQSSMIVVFPRKTADLELVTSKMSAGIDIGNWTKRPAIRRVMPERLSACSGSVTFFIEGTNIWRSTEVFLGGQKATPGSIEVLPDMEGISATFDLDKLFTPNAPVPLPQPDASKTANRSLDAKANETKTVELIVATRNGSTTPSRVAFIAENGVADCSTRRLSASPPPIQ